MKYLNSTCLILLSTLVLLAACQDKASALGTEAKSVNWYMEHAQQAMDQAGTCKAMEKNELSTMTRAQRKEWNDTSAGINCRNARQAAAQTQWNEYQERLRKDSERVN